MGRLQCDFSTVELLCLLGNWLCEPSCLAAPQRRPAEHGTVKICLPDPSRMASDADTGRWIPRGALAGVMREHLTLEVYSKPSRPPLTTTTKFQVLERPPISRHEDALNQTCKFDCIWDGCCLTEHDDSRYRIHCRCPSVISLQLERP
ncbi:hypothetical protein HDV63DRAFT_376968 [Trichoderma sp. SZMC 28014]